MIIYPHIYCIDTILLFGFNELSHLLVYLIYVSASPLLWLIGSLYCTKFVMLKLWRTTEPKQELYTVHTIPWSHN